MVIYRFIDNEPIDGFDSDTFKKFGLEQLFNLTNGEWKTNFVGFVILKDDILVSFPKQFKEKILDISKVDVEFLKLFMLKVMKEDNLINESDDGYRNFPLNSYLKICDYFQKFGLFTNMEKEIYSGSTGKINWTKTMRNSNKVISNSNLIFMPFQLERKRNDENFITECMSYVLYDGYQKIGQQLEIGVPFYNNSHGNMLDNVDMVIKRLKKSFNRYFKDHDLKLINSLIEYFEYTSTLKNNPLYLLTKDFKSIWSHIVNNYLSHHLESVDELLLPKNDERIVIENEKEFIIETEGKTSKNFNYKIRVDHIYVSENMNDSFVLDSKYYTIGNKVLDLNYKQIVYEYVIRSADKKTGEPLLYDNLKENNDTRLVKGNLKNGLIFPTYRKNHSKTHLDTTDQPQNPIGNLMIKEYYLNIEQVMKSYLIM